METTKMKTCSLPAALPYALDYLGFVLLAALGSYSFFLGRTENRVLAMVGGTILTLLAAYLIFRWQRHRWQQKKKRLEHRALALWLGDFLLAGNIRDMDEWVTNLLGAYAPSPAAGKGRPLIRYQGAMVRLYSLRRHSSCPADAQQVMQFHDAALCAGNQGAVIVSTAGFTEAAMDYALTQPSLVLMDMDELAAQAQQKGVPVPMAQKEHYWALARRALQKEKRQRRVSRPRLLPARLAFSAVLLAVLTLLLPHKLWTALLAGLCASAAVVLAFLKPGSR